MEGLAQENLKRESKTHPKRKYVWCPRVPFGTFGVPNGTLKVPNCTIFGFWPVRTYVVHMLRTYVILYCNWLIV